MSDPTPEPTNQSNDPLTFDQWSKLYAEINPWPSAAELREGWGIYEAGMGDSLALQSAALQSVSGPSGLTGQPAAPEVVERARALLAMIDPSGPWEPYFTIHGDPYVVDPTSPNPFNFGRIAEVCVSPADYGRANAEFIGAAPTLVADLLALVAATPLDEQLRDVVRMAIESLKGHGLDSIRDSLKDALDTESRP